MSAVEPFEVGVLVRASGVPAASAGEAIALVMEAIREGIGPDPADGHRRWDIAGRVSMAAGEGDSEVRINERMLDDLATELGVEIVGVIAGKKQT